MESACSASTESNSKRGEIGASPGGGVLRAGDGNLLAAHRRRAVEEAAGGRHAHHRRDLGAAPRLAEHRNLTRIPAERGDIVANPAQGEDQIELPRIAAVGKAGIEPAEVEIAEGVEAMLNGHHHDVVQRQPGAIELRIGRASR